MHFLLTSILILTSSLGYASVFGTIVLTDQKLEVLHNQSQYLIDSSHRSLDQIESAQFAKGFTKDFYDTEYDIWIKWAIENQSNDESFMLTIDQWEQASLSYRRADSIWVTVHSGTSIAPKDRPESLHRLLTFPIYQSKGSKRTYYLKVKNNRHVLKFYSSRYNFLTKSQWEVATPARTKFITNQITLFFILGICFILVLYNSILFFNNPRKDLLVLILYIIVTAIFLSNIHGITTNYFFVSFTGFELYLGLILSHVNNIILALYIWVYLKPKLKSIQSGILIGYMSYMIFSLCTSIYVQESFSYEFRRVLELIVLAGVFGIAFKQKQDGVWYLFAAILFAVVGSNFSELLANNIGILLKGDIPYLIGVLVQLILFTWGSTYTVRRLERQVKKTLKENQRILLSQNDNLNHTVAKRTSELQKLSDKLLDGNTKLRKQRKDLKLSLKEVQIAQEQLVLSEKMASLGILSAGIGHEINNPLNFIKGGVDTIKLKIEESRSITDVRKHIPPILEIVNTGVDRVSAIVKSLSHFSRHTGGSFDNCSLQTIVDNCLVMLANQIKGKVTVIKSYHEGDEKVIGNEGRLHQAILNLLANAEQAIEKKGRIQIITDFVNNHLVLIISDNGCGIEKENLSKIGDHFFTTKAPGIGTGLGLSITYRIIEEHQGTIKCDSTVNKGTTFTITFPIAS